jgi:hypothetical protein
MKRLVFAAALIVAGFFQQIAYADDDSTECFSSPEGVQEAHPGSHTVYTTHATWWTESSKCWFAGKPVTKPKTKAHAAAAAAPAPSPQVAQALPPQPNPSPPKQEVSVAYEEVAAALRAMMFGPEESSTDFEGRFSAIANAPTFYLWRRCSATPTWDLCRSST